MSQRLSWLSKIALALTTIAALTLIIYLREQRPSTSEKVAPMIVPAEVGKPAQARNFQVEVKRLKLAQAYRIDGKGLDDPSVMVKADGVWLSALVEVTALEQPGHISARLLTAQGRYYAAAGANRPRLPGVNLVDMYLVTGLPGTGAYFFDVPAEQLQGARLQFYWGLSQQPADMDHLLDVDLGLDAAALEALRKAQVPELDMRTRMNQ